MAKEQLTYRSYTTSQLKSRSTIPAQVDITEDTGKILCNNITTAQIRNAISASTNRVKDLCTHNNINRWSAFSPIKRSVSNGWLVNSVPTSNYKMGDFMGYNHNAVAPHYDVSGSNETVTVNPNGSFVFHCKADIGEIRYNDIVGKNPGTHVAFSVWKGQTYIDSRVKAISGMTNIADFDTSAEDRITVSDINDTSVYTCKIEILDSPSYDYQGGNTICQVPGLKNWTTTIYVRAANHFYISAPYASFPPSIAGSTYTFGEWVLDSASLYISTGEIMFHYLHTTSYPNQTPFRSWSHLHISAWIEEGYYNDNGTWIGTKVTDDFEYLWDGAWATDSGLGEVEEMIWKSGGVAKSLPIPNNGYGYRVVIYCDPQ